MFVFITGGTRGIGKAIVERFAKEGHTVIYTYQTHDDLALIEDELYKNIHGYKCDMKDYNACVNLANKVLSEYGRIDVLVNNAGITRDKTFAKMTKEQWDEVMQVNLLSVFNFTQIFYNKMRDQDYGRIISMASVIGQKGGFGQTNYAASKAGIIGFTKALALEAASKNITVNAIAPGFTSTEMVAAMPPEVLAKIEATIPQKRLCTPMEIAEIVYFLTTDAASYITGQVMNMNGGLYL
ncbi:MAG: beta-ketoacyl-ACP reductase [Oscillospiraceae bacterium]